MLRSKLLPTSLVPRVAGCWLLAAASFPGLAIAQRSPAPAPEPAVAPGTRVRITVPGEARRVGTVVAIVGDTLVAQWERGGARGVALSQLSRLEVSRGRHRRPWRGAGLGLALGATVGAVVGAATYEGCEGRANCMELGGPGTNAVAAALVIGVAGAAVGGVLGASRPTEAWRSVPRERLRVGITMLPGGLGLALSF